MYSKGDFHIHTTASDGRLSPSEVVKLAKKNSTNIIAITDHDNTNGLEEALNTGRDEKIKVIPGIELSTTHNGESIHVLGYFKDASYKSPSFQSFLSEISEHRIWRAKKIVENLKKYFNIELDYNKIYNDAKGIIARPHIAKAIIAAGYDYSWNYIFDNIISNESPAYVPNKKISIDDGIKLLKSVNALCVLAHPVLIKKSNVEDILKFDFDGVEAIYSQNTENDTKRLCDIAIAHNKFITAGSDYHGIDSGDTKHGIIGSVFLSGELLEKFLMQFSY